MLTDPVADLLTRIRNASASQHRRVVVPSSKVKIAIAKILTEEGFIAGYSVTDDKPQANLIMGLKYTGKAKPVITNLERVSKPGRRVYVGYRDIPWVRSGLGINIVSTPKGVMTGRQARKEQAGGELLCNVW
ncbi:MAG: 30S ribosomal protein S8 [Caldilineaceae bacterium]|nr:30S ribosomal protein S8 [Caldilineaceae bacterium]HRJ40238.1 30S ribosomal protein S8 [Caldilineaceae bacterium]